MSFAAYSRLKLHSVVDMLSDVVAEVCNYPAESNHATFVRDLMRKWAESRYAPPTGGELSQSQIQFLKTFDIRYTQRRLRFMIQGVNQLYGRAGREGWPSRQELDNAKQALYRLRREVGATISPKSLNGLIGTVIDCFGETRLGVPLKTTRIDDGTYESQWREGIDTLVDELGKHLDATLADFRDGLYNVFTDVTYHWKLEARQEMLARYLGFPFWDIPSFPIRTLSDVGELDKIEVVRISPQEAKLLSPRGNAKLKGIGAHHFAAFFERSYRENDYLWGRLDGAERLSCMLLTDEGAEHHAKTAFRAIIDEERPQLTKVQALMTDLEQQIG